MNGFVIPLIEIIGIGGIVCWIGFYVVKGFHNAWSKSAKFFWKFKIMRKSYPETTLKWCLNCIDEGIGYYDTKKMLLIKMLPDAEINEIMWIYDQVINEFNNQNKQKGGIKHGREFKGSDCKDESKSELPTISKG